MMLMLETDRTLEDSDIVILCVLLFIIKKTASFCKSIWLFENSVFTLYIYLKKNQYLALTIVFFSPAVKINFL